VEEATSRLQNLEERKSQEELDLRQPNADIKKGRICLYFI
jgi:hypothetical protein